MRTLYANVIVDITLSDTDRSFTYRVPDELAEAICPGAAVRVPFGKGGRLVTGCVVSLTDTPDCPPEYIKPLAELVTGENVVEAQLLSLAVWMQHRYGSPLAKTLKVVLPWRKSVKDRVEKTVRLSISENEAAKRLKAMRIAHRTAQARVLELLIKKMELPYTALLHEARVDSSVMKALVSAGVITITEDTVFRSVVGSVEKTEVKTLSDLQIAAREEILEEWAGDDRPVLIHGVTGSGKTEVYMDLIERVLAEGKEAIVLIPEIALTYQTVRRFAARFGDTVSFLHSRLSEGEKFDQFKAAKSGRIRIMVGPRSALFTPFSHLGLIVMDEEHEGSYISESTPRYHARETAEERARLAGAHFVMGSASPSLDSYYRCELGLYRLVKMTGRFGAAVLPDTAIIDMKMELARGRRSVLSRRLEEELRLRLENGEQSMLFINRRGLAGFVSCRECGHVETCPHCDVSMTHHRGGRLICHYCGYEKPMVKICPSCGSSFFGGMRAGTEAVETLLKKTFPEARVLRMDMDTTGGKEGHEKLLKAFAEGEADILVGTQMIVKGHDFPRVTLVGALMADLSLHESDYRSAERTFQLLLQAAGRAGRGKRKGLALIQTYDPEHYALTTAAAQDYEAFYNEEMVFRKLMGYPPTGLFMAILVSGEDECQLDTGMTYLRQFIDRLDPGGRLMTIGPAPQAIGKIKDRYRRVIYLRHKDVGMLIKVRERLMQYIEVNKGFESLNIQFDMNA
ncbi:MAG: primosomal protein N' [Lachnospiraceae bacterium]|nr:primosomal protein N' [Lachnospiraceae bacterium]